MRAFESLTPGTALTATHRVVGQQVPQGLPLVMEQGQTGKVTQALGDSVSLELDGRLARFEASQLAAFDVSQPIETATPDEPLEDQVWTVLQVVSIQKSRSMSLIWASSTICVSQHSLTVDNMSRLR